MSVETELKLALRPEQARRLLKSDFWKPLRLGRKRRQHLLSTYFDTPKHLLRKSGMALRIRDDDGRCEQTLKVPAAGPPGLQNHHEWSHSLNGSELQLQSIRDAGIAPFLADRRSGTRLRPLFATDFERTSMQLQSGSTQLELAVDIGWIRAERGGAMREEPICELELELVSGEVSGLLDVALEVCRRWGALPAYRTKAERGYALASRAMRPKPCKPAGVVLDANMSAGEAFMTVLTSALEHLARNRVPLLEGRPDGVHQTRVAMRRLRAAMQAFEQLLPARERKGFNSEWRWFLQQLGPARDWHVYLSETLPAIGLDRSAGSLRKLRRAAARERRRATQAAIELLNSTRYALLVLQFQKFVVELEKSVSAKQWNQPVVPFARRQLRKASRALLQEKRPLGRLSDEKLHEVRKRCKKLRYATEFFSSLWVLPQAQAYTEDLANLQTCLGEANDAAVALQMLRTARPGRLRSDSTALVKERTGQRRKACVAAARPYWRRLRRAPEFWLQPPTTRGA